MTPGGMSLLSLSAERALPGPERTGARPGGRRLR